jgi:uncharacterized protein
MTTGTLRIAVLGATGALGGALVGQALARGHAVVALVRDPGRLTVPAAPALTVVTADVRREQSVVDGLRDADAVVSGLGNAAGDTGTLTAGARALARARERDPALRLVWIGGFGSGESAGAAGWAGRTLATLALKAELPDKVAADTAIRRAGGTVMHVALMVGGALSRSRRTVDLKHLPRRVMPRFVSRATVAAAMLDEAENPRYTGETVVPLS